MEPYSFFISALFTSVQIRFNLRQSSFQCKISNVCCSNVVNIVNQILCILLSIVVYSYISYSISYTWLFLHFHLPWLFFLFMIPDRDTWECVSSKLVPRDRCQRGACSETASRWRQNTGMRTAFSGEWNLIIKSKSHFL